MSCSSVAGVGVRYGDRWALRDVTVELPAGSTTALVGPNGAGKSTLLNALAGVLEPTRGVVRTVRHPAYVLQRSVVPDTMPLSVRETVAMGAWAGRGLLRPIGRHRRSDVDRAIELLGITALAGRQLGELSGGQRQRVLVAQAIAQRSDLLLLDEPSNGLDAVARDRIGEAIAAEVERGVAVVHSTHELGEAATSDQVVLLVDGEQRASGRPADALRVDVLAAAYGQVVPLPDGAGVVALPAGHHPNGQGRNGKAPNAQT